VQTVPAGSAWSSIVRLTMPVPGPLPHSTQNTQFDPDTNAFASSAPQRAWPYTIGSSAAIAATVICRSAAGVAFRFSVFAGVRFSR
jgi:hypothetical protein